METRPGLTGSDTPSLLENLERQAFLSLGQVRPGIRMRLAVFRVVLRYELHGLQQVARACDFGVKGVDTTLLCFMRDIGRQPAEPTYFSLD